MVTCSNCGAENSVGHGYCSNCGQVLEVVCRTCDTSNDAGNKFCFNCGSPLATEIAADPEAKRSEGTVAERRFVSVVFADLVGFTTFSESRDAEDVRSMLTAYYEKCREIIDRYGGVTDKFIGDAVMGVWGAEAAHEDDAERATRAALELVDMVAGLGKEIDVEDLAARAGVLSGEAAVGPGGNEHGLVVGDLVNTASRLQSIAPSGGVLVGESTRDLVGSVIEFTPIGEQHVKGKEIPVAAFQALRVLAISSHRNSGELGEGPFVGRDDELRMLKDQLHAAGREKRGRLVSIIGEGGIGKTRLSRELLRHIDGIADDIYYHSGRSPSYGDGVAFWALGEMIRQRAGISEGEDESKSRMKLRTKVAELVPDGDDQRWIEPRLAALIGLADMPTGDRAELFSALRTFFQKIAEQGTVLMVFEDLHWADDGLMDFIDELVERTTQHPILVLSLGRPELLERRPGWGSSMKRTVSTHLGRLEQDDMRLLVAGLAPGLPDGTVNRIAERTAGVPLHAVEFVRMMLNSGRLVQVGETFRLDDEDEELSIPDSVQAIIGARLDRLSADEVSILQDAAVLGLSFTTTDLGEIRERSIEEVEPILRNLVRREVLEFDEDPRSPERGQYRFVQSLIREVAYGRLSKSERINRHLKVAGRLEERGDIELAGVIASHYASAVASDPGNGELLDRARDAVVGAADRASSLRSAEQAAGLYLQAISMTDNPSEKAALQIVAAASYDDAGRSDKAQRTVNEALSWYRSANDSSGVVAASTQLASILSGNFEAQRAVDAVVPVFESTPEAVDETWARLASETSRALALAGRGEESIAVTDRALPVMEELDLVEELVNTLINRGTALAFLGRWLEGGATLRGAAELAKQHELTLVQLRALNNMRSVADSDILHEPATDLVMEELVERSGNLGWLYRWWYLTALARYGSGDLDEALEIIERSDSVELSEFWRDIFESMILRIRNVRYGFDEGRSRRAMALIDKFVDSSDPQTRESSIADKAWATFGAGHFVFSSQTDPGGAIDLGGYPYLYEPLLAAAAWIGDVGTLRRLAEDFKPRTRRGRVSRGLGCFSDALLAALEGDAAAAVSSYRAATDLWEETGLPMSLAVMRAAFAKSIGLDHPVGLEAGTLALEFFEEHNVQLYLDLLADGLPSSDAEETAFAV
jgi:class 3 adenylate cyclase/tetratricopeptide (TPR) repeat protein